MFIWSGCTIRMLRMKKHCVSSITVMTAYYTEMAAKYKWFASMRYSRSSILQTTKIMFSFLSYFFSYLFFPSCIISTNFSPFPFLFITWPALNNNQTDVGFFFCTDDFNIQNVILDQIYDEKLCSNLYYEPFYMHIQIQCKMAL